MLTWTEGDQSGTTRYVDKIQFLGVHLTFGHANRFLALSTNLVIIFCEGPILHPGLNQKLGI